MRKAMLVEHLLDMEKKIDNAINAIEFINGIEKEFRFEYPEIDALRGEDRKKFFDELLGQEVADRIVTAGNRLADLIADF